MKTIDTSNGTLAYDERGDGPPIILLPSGGHVRGDYDELRGLLAPEMRTIAIDWPAHGDSPPGQPPRSRRCCSPTSRGGVAALAPEGAIVLGNSVGGFAAARMAIRRPDLVRGLVIVDGGGFSSRPPQERAFCALMSRPRFLRAIYPAFARSYMRARTDADRRAREAAVEDDALSGGPRRGMRALGELCLAGARPARERGRDHGCRRSWSGAGATP